MSKVDWKQKYYELRSKYMNAIDVAFRLGVEEGQKNAELELLQMQAQQAMQPAVDENGMPIEGDPSMEDPSMQDPSMQDPSMQEQDVLDESINELEQYVKSEDLSDLYVLKKSENTSTYQPITAEKLKNIVEKIKEQQKS